MKGVEKTKQYPCSCYYVSGPMLSTLCQKLTLIGTLEIKPVVLPERSSERQSNLPKGTQPANARAGLVPRSPCSRVELHFLFFLAVEQ